MTKKGSKDILYYRSLPTLKFQLRVKFEESVRAEAMLTEKDNVRIFYLSSFILDLTFIDIPIQFIIYNNLGHIDRLYKVYE